MCENPAEHLVRNCLDSLGISKLIEWDVLNFVQRRGTSLISIQEIALLLGHESTAVGGALDRLERENLIIRSRTSQGANLFRIPDSTDAAHRHCIKQLMSLSGSRAGRLFIVKRLNAPQSESRQQKQPAGAGE